MRDFIVTATRNLVLFGPPTYEIAYLFENDGSQDARPVQFRLHLIQEGSLGSRNGTPIQYVPAELSGLVDETGLHYVELDPGVLFSLDFDLTSRRAVRQAIEFLHHADGQHDSQFALTVRALQDGGSYDFGQDQIEQSRIFAKATAAIGWNARGLFQAGHLETFDAYREIRFLKFKVQLRELALSTLNEQLRKIGERIGFQASIELVGLPSLEDVERAEEELNAGTRAISDFASLGL